MPSNETLWPLEEHTIGKHMVLKAYLQAWLPVMGLSNEQILIVDGFAGPGEYKNNEPGSPQILLDTYLEHFYQSKISGQITYYFLEKSPKRYQHLCHLLKQKYTKLPKNLSIKARCSEFSSRLSEVLNFLEAQNRVLIPSFIMIDPFGVSDTPMETINGIMKNPKSEIYVSFMYEFINRFKKSEEFDTHLTALFGCDTWRKGIDILCKEERKHFFCDLYKRQLKRAGAKYVLHFELYNGNRHVYTIFFATKHLKGVEKMKSAIWRTIPDGSYQFRGGLQNTLLDSRTIDYEPLFNALCNRFKDAFVDATEVIQFIASDNTDYAVDKIKTEFFKPFEKQGLINVNEGSRKRSFTYPGTARLRFVPDRKFVDVDN